MRYQTFLGALLGLGTSISYYALLSFLPLTQEIDGGIHDRFIELKHQEDYSEKVVIFGIDNIVGGAPQYASVLEDLLSVSKADIVVINPPRHWYGRETNENGEQLKQLVEQYENQIVLASMTAPVNPEYKTSISLYNYLIEHVLTDEEYQPRVEVEEIHGFFEFAYRSRQSGLFDSPVNRHSLEGKFIRDDDSREIDLKSVAFLVFDKLSQQSNDLPVLYHDNFLTSTAKIQTPIQALGDRLYDLSEVCGATTIQTCKLSKIGKFADLRGKVVLFGHTDTQLNAAEVQAMPTAKGEMSAVEIQANHILGLQAGEVYLLPKEWLAIAIVGIGGVFFGRVITTGISGLQNLEKKQKAYKTVLSISILFWCYALLTLSSLSAGILIPVFAPIISWIIAILTSSFILLYRNQILVAERQLSAERKAVIDQASSQLQSIASRVHQDALHHLKLAMDWLEIMQRQNPACDVTIPLNKILKANESIRGNLIETRLCAEKLAISPELKLGLPVAIRLHTKQLRKQGGLTLKVRLDMSPGWEKNFNSRWVEAREGIFSFYQEAMNNIIRHAQPSKGRATWVSIALSRQSDTAFLKITNDGGFSPVYIDETIESLGTQLMRNVADRLPAGTMSRKISSEGNFQVELSWSMKEFQLS